MEVTQHLRIPLEEIRLGTNNFSKQNYIGKGGFGKVYGGKLTISGKLYSVAVKILDRTTGQGNREFLTEIQMLSCCKHNNLVSLLGYCNEVGEMILVYEHVKNGSLDSYLNDTTLSWIQRLQISLGMAHGLDYLHNHVGANLRIVHRDFKSANILLNETWDAKISDFGLSKMTPSNVPVTSTFSNPCGTHGYVDPTWEENNILTKESDVYSFGVVLFEMLCGRLAYIKQQYEGERLFLGPFAQRHYEKEQLEDIIFPSLCDQINEDSLKVFSLVANQCLKKNPKERPKMDWIIEKLEKASELQAHGKGTRFIRVGRWGRQSGGDQWSFELEEKHKMKKITIDHGDIIYSLMFTSEFGGVLSSSNKFGGCDSGDKISEEVTFDDDEEIIGIDGTMGTQDGYKIISSLSFKTNKKTHGPFGWATKSIFSIPWHQGSLVGLYGLAGDYIDAIGVCVKPFHEIVRVGTWGSQTVGVQKEWSFQVERKHHLKKITIEHSDLIHSLVLTTEYRASLYNSEKAGGHINGDKVSEITFDWDEEVKTVKGTEGLLRGNKAGQVIISSLSFVTNKKTYGPFGRTRGTPFTVPLEDGSLAGFYGLASSYIGSIGVYLKASM